MMNYSKLERQRVRDRNDKIFNVIGYTIAITVIVGAALLYGRLVLDLSISSDVKQ